MISTVAYTEPSSAEILEILIHGTQSFVWAFNRLAFQGENREQKVNLVLMAISCSAIPTDAAALCGHFLARLGG